MPIKGYIKNNTTYITDQLYTDVGEEEFKIIAYRDPCAFLTRNFVIKTEDGYKLDQGRDFGFTSKDYFYSTNLYENEQVASRIKVINPEYQTGNLYISYHWVADYASAEMFNRFDRGLDQMINSIITGENGNVVVNNDGNVIARGEEYPGYRQEL